MDYLINIMFYSTNFSGFKSVFKTPLAVGNVENKRVGRSVQNSPDNVREFCEVHVLTIQEAHKDLQPKKGEN